MPVFWLLAGVNGAGKTTFAKTHAFVSLTGGATCLNPDAVTEQIISDAPDIPRDEANRRAADFVEAEVLKLIGRGESLVVETVLSTRKYESAIVLAKQKGYVVGMIYIGLPSVEFSAGRVGQRFAAHGHDVPVDRIRKRWSRSLDNLAYFTPLMDVLYVLSNERQLGNNVLVAVKQDGILQLQNDTALPEVTRRLRPLCSS